MDIITQALNFVQDFFENEFSGHDYFHTLRVFKMATHIAEKEQADLKTVQLAALLHDVDDRKLSPQTYAEKTNARHFLSQQGVDPQTIEEICRIIGERILLFQPLWRGNALRMRIGWMPSAPSASPGLLPTAEITTV